MHAFIHWEKPSLEGTRIVGSRIFSMHSFSKAERFAYYFQEKQPGDIQTAVLFKMNDNEVSDMGENQAFVAYYDELKLLSE